MTRKSILLVDDNHTHQYSLGRHLQESGFDVLQATDGRQALELATTRRPDAILLDINLPDMSGFEICERLKSSPDTQGIPVIFHSATQDTQSARDRVIDLGAVSFLSYPINVEHLVSVVKGAITRSQLRTPSESPGSTPYA